MFNYRVVIFLFLLITSCQVKKIEDSFFREEMLIKYLNEKTEIEVDNEFVLVLANSTDCGACSKSMIEGIEINAIYSKNLKTHFLFTEEKNWIDSSIKSDKASIHYVGSINELERYGLRFINTYIFLIRGGAIVEWQTI